MRWRPTQDAHHANKAARNIEALSTQPRRSATDQIRQLVPQWRRPVTAPEPARRPRAATTAAEIGDSSVKTPAAEAGRRPGAPAARRPGAATPRPATHMCAARSKPPGLSAGPGSAERAKRQEGRRNHAMWPESPSAAVCALPTPGQGQDQSGRHRQRQGTGGYLGNAKPSKGQRPEERARTKNHHRQTEDANALTTHTRAATGAQPRSGEPSWTQDSPRANPS